MTFEQAMQELLERQREERDKLASEADARRNWLKEFANVAVWIETFVGGRDDEHLAWYTLPDSPGLFEHGITSERVAELVRNLERARGIFGGSNVKSKKGR